MLKSKKSIFYKNMVENVKESDPRRWYSTLKRISNFDSDRSEELQVAEINHLTDEEQAEAIADSINKISREYEEVNSSEIQMPNIPPNSTPKFAPWEISKYMQRIKTNKASLPGDIPARIVKNCSASLSVPMTHIINHSIQTGSWPDAYKEELITPIGKVIPTESLDQIRPISNLSILDKIQKFVISDLIVSDIKTSHDPTQ